MDYFKGMPHNAKVWVYQSNRTLIASEVAEIEQSAIAFTQAWDAHGKSLQAKVLVLFHTFILLAVDETSVPVSGCAIDKSVGWIKQIEKQFNLQLFDRLTAAFIQGHDVVLCSMDTLQQKLNEGVINENTMMFNNHVSNLAQLNTQWQLPLKQSWHARMLNFSHAENV